MIGYLKGKVAILATDYVLLDVRDVGYRIFISDNTRQTLSLNAEAQLYTYLNVKEDALHLYGFATQEEYDIFQLLISVSGIGPRLALGILSHISVSKLCSAIRAKESAVLTKLPGIGKKTAARLVLELKDKVSINAEDNSLDESIRNASLPHDNNLAEAQAALMSLGYGIAEITSVLKKIDTNQEVEVIIKLALKEINHF